MNKLSKEVRSERREEEKREGESREQKRRVGKSEKCYLCLLANISDFLIFGRS